MRGAALLSTTLLGNAILLCLLVIHPAAAVRRGDFKTCSQAGFCERNRARADRQAVTTEWKSPYAIVGKTRLQGGVLNANISNALFPSISFGLNILFADDGTTRIQIDEIDGLRQRYNEAARWTLIHDPVANQNSQLVHADGASIVKYGPSGDYVMELQHSPIKVVFLREGQPHIILNERNLFNMEHFRVKPVASGNETTVPDPITFQHTDNSDVPSIDPEIFKDFVDKNQDGWWEESFGGRTDSKPKGPESLSLDIVFPGYSHIYGIPQHASPLSLKTTRGTEDTPLAEAYKDPYRLFNTDIFEYEHDSEMATYGAIPFLQASRPGSTVAVFWLNVAETWIDVTKSATPGDVSKSWKAHKDNIGDHGPDTITTSTHWISETGILDLFIFLGPTPDAVFSAYSRLVGTTLMPLYSAIEYHQCRWNYVSQEDVLGVIKKFDEADIPLGFIWLDIEYAQDHKYFIWDPKTFPDPAQMVKELESTGRKLVTIVDPHIKRTEDLYVYKEAQELNVLCKQSDGTSEYEGWCWTGSSSWIDSFDPKSWEWWASLFKFDRFKGTTLAVHNWLDMNEPAVFNAPEVTMPRDNTHYGGWEHRDLHNLYGMVTHNQSVRGLRERVDPPMRGFVLSRSFFAGTQRFGAIWQGDNMGTWDHLAVSIPMLLSNGVAGMAFNGADVGGFFGNPSEEMLVRWYQAGAFMPFFRAHAHIDTKRREPYIFEEPTRSQIRDMIRLRYSLLVTWYTAFFESSNTGHPIARPMYTEFPGTASGFGIDDQFFVGTSGLLVKPIVGEGVTETEIYLPDNEPYYNYFTHDVFVGSGTGGSKVKFPAPLDVVPVFIRGGHIVAHRHLIRRAAALMWRDPISLAVTLNNEGTAHGSLYLDDGESFQHDSGHFVYRTFSLFKGDDYYMLSSHDGVTADLKTSGLSSSITAYHPDNKFAAKAEPISLDEIKVLGLPKPPTCIRVAGQDMGLEFQWQAGLASTTGRRKSGLWHSASVLRIKRADVKLTKDWSIKFEYADVACKTQVKPTWESQLQSPDCAVGHFRCANSGHLSSCVRFSRVNDGICDPECCDGSDEFDGKVSCPNRCKEVGAEYRKSVEAEARKVRVGGKERQNYIAFGKREKARLEESIAKTELEVVTLQGKESAAKKALDRVEAVEAQEVELKKASVLYKRITEHQIAIRLLRKQRQVMEADLAQLKAILTDLKAGYNPNYQDMAVKGAVKGFEDWEKEVDEPSSTTDYEKDTLDTEDIKDEDLIRMEDEDPLIIMSSLEPEATIGKVAVESASALSKLGAYLPDSLKSPFNLLRKRFLDALGLIGILPGGSKAGDRVNDPDRPDIVAARKTFQDAERALKDVQATIDTAKRSLDKDWGQEWEFKKLDKQCFSMESGEYTYEVCMFDQAYQKSSSGSRTNLGRFSEWNTAATVGSPEYYTKQKYTQGTRCWNGPERSVQLDLSCGTTNALLSVMEPEKCEYHIKMTTPAVCVSKEELEEKDAAKEEL